MLLHIYERVKSLLKLSNTNNNKLVQQASPTTTAAISNLFSLLFC